MTEKGKGGRKTKYTPDRVQTILDAIALTGSDEAGYKAGEINRDTFYEWKNKYSDFSDKCNKAKSEYRETCPEVLVRQANKAFSDYLHGRMERVVTTTKSGMKGEMPFEEETMQRIPIGIPKWAIDRVLGKPADEIEALKVLAAAGWLPHWITKIAIDELSGIKQAIREVFAGILPDGGSVALKPGLSEHAADIIRRQILGVESASTTSVPGEVGSRSSSDQSGGEVEAGRTELG